MANTSLAVPGFTVLGTIVLDASTTANGITLAAAFPNLAIQGETVASVIFCTGEANGASAIIYIGDLSMTSNPAATCAYTLKGPAIINTSLSNMGGLNTIPLGNIKVNTDTAGSKLRVSVLAT